MLEPIDIRQATLEHARMLYQFCVSIPELQVTPSAPFMTPDEFCQYLSDSGRFIALMATDCSASIQGFALCSLSDFERPKYACLVYIAVHPECRGLGVGTALLAEIRAQLATQGIRDVYAWARLSEDGSPSPIVSLLIRSGWLGGHRYQYMSVGGVVN